jgi:hypothetical protein
VTTWRFCRSLPCTQEGTCERPKELVDLDSGDTMVVQCGATARSRCAPCSFKYKRRVGRIFMSGYTDDPTARLYGLTLTAPGDETHCKRHHKIGCTGDLHPDCDMCACTPPGGVNLAEWNASAGARWNDFITALRKKLGVDVQYCKAAECQHRGALHFHAMVRTDAVLSLKELRALAMSHGFGHEVDLDAFDTEDPYQAQRAAWYCAKYVSKTCDDRGSLPWLDRHTGELTEGNSRYRAWTSSRTWGLSMAALRRYQQAWARAMAEGAGDPSGVATPLAAEPPLDPNSASYAGSTPAKTQTVTQGVSC